MIRVTIGPFLGACLICRRGSLVSKVTMLRYLIAALACSVLVSNAQACVCVRAPEDRPADLIFTGVATAITEWHLQTEDKSGPYAKAYRVAFNVKSISKGPPLKLVVVDTPTHNCGVAFEVGHTYRVLAQYMPEQGMQWYVDHCGGTRHLSRKTSRSKRKEK